MKNSNLVPNFIQDLLDPVNHLSCDMQGDVCDILFPRSGIETPLHCLEELVELGADGLSKTCQFYTFVEEAESSFSTDPNGVFIKGAYLSDVETGLRTDDQVMDYAHNLKERLNRRFHDLQTDDVSKL